MAKRVIIRNGVLSRQLEKICKDDIYEICRVDFKLQFDIIFDTLKPQNKAEFAAYSIIYCLYTKNMTDMTKRLSQLSEDMAKDQLISDALKLRSHLSLNNYLGFFRIYKRSSAHMKERIFSLSELCKIYLLRESY